MDKSRWNNMQRLFEAALPLPANQRKEFLVRECNNDEVMLKDVNELLDAHTGNLPKWTTTVRDGVKEIADSRIGKEIGQHRIIEKIGVGGMGVIYKAHDKHLDRDVALKFLPDVFLSDREARARFMTEARAASRLDHPHICVIHNISQTSDGQLYITMPFYNGETLDKQIARGALPLPQALEISIQVCDGLSEAHRHHIVHRDIKPPNIMLTDNGAKILDFGIAKLDNIRLTSTGNSIGTVAYMAPEQLRGDPVDARADVWALGATLFEMICGRRAFPGRAIPQIVQSVLYTDTDPVQDLSADLPIILSRCLRRALSRDMDQRFSSMDEMLDELIQVRNQLTANHHVHLTEKTVVNKRFDWDPKLLQEFTDILLPYVGPLATTIVNNGAKQAQDINSLCQSLADKIPSTTEREEFLGKIKLKVATNTHPPTPKTVQTDGTSQGITLTPEESAVLEEQFTPYIGPIAGALIRRAITQATDFNHLCEWLADQIPSENERKIFLQQVHHTTK